MTFRRSSLASGPRAAAVLVAAAAAAALALAACGGPPVGASSSSVQAAPPASTSPTSCAATQDTQVSSASQLRSALATARPGSTIILAPGSYLGRFEAKTSGTQAQPITLCGPRSAILDGGELKSGYTFHLDHANWWRLEGFTVTEGQKGVVTDESDHDLIDGLYVYDIGDEGIHLRDFSSYDTVADNLIRNTGRYESYYGEGIYIGSANKNWCRYSGCKPDGSDYDVITGNNIADTSAENVDIKEGTVGGVVSGNHFNGTGMNPSSATSWVNVKGNDWRITDNTGVDSVDDGLSDHQVYPGWGIDNVFIGNRITVNGPGYGIFVQNRRLGVQVSCDNSVTGAARGFSSIACVPA
jgi:hypothetical protein